MKKFTQQIAPMILLATLLASCIEINTYGPQGPRGKAYFGIDYDYNPPNLSSINSLGFRPLLNSEFQLQVWKE